MFLLLVVHGPVDDFVHRFIDHQAFAVDQRDERIGSGFDVADQFGIQDECFAVQSRQLDHLESSPCPDAESWFADSCSKS